MRTLYENILSAVGKENAMLVSIVEASGSAPRGLGAKMLVRADGTTAGTIGGGAVEHAAIVRAVAALDGRRCFLEQYSLSSNEVSDLGMICGGDVTVCFQYLDTADREAEAVFSAVMRCYGENRPCALVTAIRPEGCRLYLAALASPAPPPEEAASLDFGRLQVTELDGVRYVVEPLVTGERALIFGAGHVGQELCQLLRWLEYYVVVLDDREDFIAAATSANERRLIRFETGVEEAQIGQRDCVIIMTRGHLHDYTVLRAALATSSRYIGMIGSRAKVAASLDKLRADGFSQEDIDRVRAPIGLPLGGKTPKEVALSTAAEMARVRNGYTER